MADSNKNQFDPTVGGFGKVLKPLISSYSDRDVAFIEKAFNFAKEKHKSQSRISGEPYFIHPLGVAINIIKHNPDSDTIAAALLHDVVEDCGIQIFDLSQIFNQDVATLVDGVTKISSIKMKDKALGLEFSKNHFSTQIDSYRKLLTAMAGDPRVLIIKLYDRLHNSQTLEWLPDEKRKFYAKETIEIFAALAERIGMGELKASLEDLCFPYAYPEKYEVFIRSITTAKSTREKYINRIISKISKHIPNTDVHGRVKHNFSIFNKLKERNSIDQIFDLVAIRIICRSTPDCYKILGKVHELFDPINEEFNDYIAKPRNGIYRSLHTTVKGPEEQVFEIQIRTEDMHKTAEFGIASHWYYKENKLAKISKKSAQEWLPELEGGRFLESNIKFFANKIFVFSPKGKIVELVKNATPLDFAFHIHTDLGFSCCGAKVNSKMVPLSSNLKTGDVVEVIKNERAKPSRDWLAFVKTNFARSKIREYFFDLDRPKYYQAGLLILNEELANFDKDVITEKNIKQLSNKIVDSRLPFNDLYTAIAAIGKRDISKNEIIKILYPDITFSEKKVLKKDDRSKNVQFEIGQGFVYRLANCCKPKDGDDILGYITLQKTITVHKTKCMEAKRFDTERIINAYWN
ncbi:MAG: RelA/SpoT family protein [Patescibacteria group bacterium]|jgi:GTP pyrophosphokinase